MLSEVYCYVPFSLKGEENVLACDFEVLGMDIFLAQSTLGVSFPTFQQLLEIVWHIGF